MYYRFSDALKQAGMVSFEPGWDVRLHAMMRYASSASTCRRSMIARWTPLPQSGSATHTPVWCADTAVRVESSSATCAICHSVNTAPGGNVIPALLQALWGGTFSLQQHVRCLLSKSHRK